MQYKYAVDNLNYEDLASGRVLYYRKGTTSFPARLASELFCWCKTSLERAGVPGPYTVYDPCCGGAFLLVSIGYLHPGDIGHLIGSDIDRDLVALAGDNLSLLTPEGIDRRIEQLARMADEYGKDSHAEALQSAERFKKMSERIHRHIGVRAFQADATALPLSSCFKADIVISDIPYGNMVEWRGGKDENTLNRMLSSLLPYLAPSAVVCIVGQKGEVIGHDLYHRIKRMKIGKRQIFIFSNSKHLSYRGVSDDI